MKSGKLLTVLAGLVGLFLAFAQPVLAANPSDISVYPDPFQTFGPKSNYDYSANWTPHCSPGPTNRVDWYTGDGTLRSVQQGFDCAAGMIADTNSNLIPGSIYMWSYGANLLPATLPHSPLFQFQAPDNSSYYLTVTSNLSGYTATSSVPTCTGNCVGAPTSSVTIVGNTTWGGTGIGIDDYTSGWQPYCTPGATNSLKWYKGDGTLISVDGNVYDCSSSTAYGGPGNFPNWNYNASVLPATLPHSPSLRFFGVDGAFYMTLTNANGAVYRYDWTWNTTTTVTRFDWTWNGTDYVFPAATTTPEIPAFVPTQPALNTVCPDVPSSVKNLVFITHGWNDEATSSTGWVQQTAALIRARLPDNTWGVCAFDWSKDADTGFGSSVTDLSRLANAAYVNGGVVGGPVGVYLAAHKFNTIHLIAHSAGSNVIQTAAQIVQSFSPQTQVHLTFLDAFDPSGGNRHYGLDPRNIDSLYTLHSDWWAEQYVDERGAPVLADTNLTLSDAFNIDVTHLDPDQAVPIDALINQAYLTRVHAWPHVWYQSSIVPTFSSYGFPLSIESGSQKLPTQVLLPGQLCILQTSNTTCPVSSKSAPIYSVANTTTSDLVVARANGAIDFSPTGEITFPDSLSAILTPHSPVWFVLHVTTTAPENVLNFDYAFLPVSGSQEMLAVFVDDNLVYKVDERLTDSGTHSARNIAVGDLTSGPHTIEFRLDPFTDTKSSIQISNIQLGLLSSTQISDFISPTTTPTLAGLIGTNGWYLGTTTVALSAADNPGGVGVQQTLYSLDGSAWQTYATSSPIVIKDDGIHSLQYYSLDNFNNREATNTLSIKIDATYPEAILTVSTSSKDLMITGIDNLSSTTVNKTATTTTVTDQAGNITTLTFQKTFSGNLLTLASLTKIAYGNGMSISLPTQFVYVWNPLTNPPALVSQTVIADSTFGIEALYDKTKNKTTIIVKKKGTAIQAVTVPGLGIIKLITNKGSIGYSW